MISACRSPLLSYWHPDPRRSTSDRSCTTFYHIRSCFPHLQRCKRSQFLSKMSRNKSFCRKLKDVDILLNTTQTVSC